MKQHIDTSLDLYIVPHKKGIRLVSPESLSEMQRNASSTIKDIFELPFNVYFTDVASANQRLNEVAAAACGFDSAKDSIGKTSFDIFTLETARRVVEQDHAVMKDQILKISEEEVALHDEVPFTALSLEMPWYDGTNTILGVFGFSVILGKQALSSSLMEISKLGFLNQEFLSAGNLLPGSKICDSYLTQKESAVLKLLQKGHTAKNIAQIFDCSPRTIEKHLEHIKLKLKVCSKSELINKLSGDF